MQDLQKQFGEIDIYLFDQILKGRFDNCKTVLDAGCGSGRNLNWFLQNGFEVFGVDQNPEAIRLVKELTHSLSSTNSINNFQVTALEKLPFQNASFDIVICSAVLHFAKDHSHFHDMLMSCWRVLKPGGYFFARLASNIGIENFITDTGGGRFHLPDGSERYLVDLPKLLNYTKQLNGQLVEPIKTTNVQNMRCMTTWCVLKL